MPKTHVRTDIHRRNIQKPLTCNHPPVAHLDFPAQKTEEESCHLLWPPEHSFLNVTTIEWGPDLSAVSLQLLPAASYEKKRLVQTKSEHLWMQKIILSKGWGSPGGVSQFSLCPWLFFFSRKPKSQISEGGIQYQFRTGRWQVAQAFILANGSTTVQRKKPGSYDLPSLGT